MPRALALLLALLALFAGGCSDLLGSRADAVVRLSAEDANVMSQVRRQVRESAAQWEGLRVGDDTTNPDKTVMEFMLPSSNIDMAVASLGRTDGKVISTKVNVDVKKLTAGEADARSGDRVDATDDQVRLRVEISTRRSSATKSLIGAVTLLFALIGLVSSSRWVGRKFSRRSPRRRQPNSPRRHVERPDLDDGPPTEETPTVPPRY